MTQLTVNFLESIRIAELRLVEQMLINTTGAGSRILEVGAGAGWQARYLSDKGHIVEAIDVPDSCHRKERIWPVADFDGNHIPFPDASFDVVWSSNVLEHVENLEFLNQELLRVLRPGGVAIHYVPTATWRLGSLLAFYPSLLREVFWRLSGKIQPMTPPEPSETTSSVAARPAPTFLQKAWRRITPHAHGARGTCWSELIRFRRETWDQFFSQHGWSIESYTRNGLFLTGEMLLGARLPVTARQALSHWVGYTAHLYVLKAAAKKISGGQA